MSLDPASCPHYGVSRFGEPIPPYSRGLSGSEHYSANVVLIVGDDADGYERPQYYRCDACKKQTPLTFWNRGCGSEFLAAALMSEFEARSSMTRFSLIL